MRFGALLFFAAIAAFGQARLNYFEGEVILNGQKLERNDAQAIPPGATLTTTTTGRVEVFLAPDVYLRVGEQASVRIGSDIELVNGSAVIDSARASDNVSRVTVKVGGASVQFTKPGDYRLDSEPPQLMIYRGAAQVSQNGQITPAIQSQKALPLGQPGQATPNPDTLLDIWSTNRRIRLSSVSTGARPPEQPLTDDHSDVTAPSSLIGLLPLTGVPELMYTPIRPYRPGSPFYGPSSGFLYPYYRPYQPFSAPYRTPVIRPPGVPRFPGIGGPHIPGPVIGH
jgi:hypothetical protein